MDHQLIVRDGGSSGRQLVSRGLDMITIIGYAEIFLLDQRQLLPDLSDPCSGLGGKHPLYCGPHCNGGAETERP